MDVTPIESGPEHSPPPFSDSTMSWSWSQLRHDLEDSNNEMFGLVEDKEIAARAVAFVVNSTRKGIVPLCADVANLMRTKKCLERKVYLLKKETEVYHSSAGSVPSHSMSPTPPSLSSYTENCIKALQDQSLAVQEHYRSSSRCSNSSSTYSYSPKMDKPRGGSLRLHGVQYSPSYSRDTRKHSSPRLIHSVYSGFREPRKHCGKPLSVGVASDRLETDVIDENDDVKVDIECEGAKVTDINEQNDIHLTAATRGRSVINDNPITPNTDQGVPANVTSVFSFHIEDETINKTTDTCPQQTEDTNTVEVDAVKNDTFNENEEHRILANKRTLLERRRVSLPEMTMIPNKTALKIRPKQSKQVQCSLSQSDACTDLALEEQFVKSVKLNAKLEEDLAEARKEIEQLKKRLKVLEAAGAIPKTNFYADDDKIVEDNGYYTGSNRTSRNSSEHEKSRGHKKSSPKRQAATPVSYGGPLPTCKCTSCQEALGSDDDLSHYSDHYLDEPSRYAVNSKLKVQLEDHVVTKGDHSGYIRYIGHVDKKDQTHTLFIGLELDEPVGHHDGFYIGKRYFYCKRNHGMFIPLNDVVGKVSKKTQVKPAKDDVLKIRKHTKKTSTKDEKVTQL